MNSNQSYSNSDITQNTANTIQIFEKPFDEYTITEFCCFGILVMLIVIFFFWFFKLKK